jgi:hypothetical protein
MFNNKNISTPMAQIIIGGERLDLVKERTLLGLKIDLRWTWNKQVEVMKEVCLKRIVILKRLSSTKWENSPTVLGTFYKQYIRPKMEYGVVAYGHTNKKTCRNWKLSRKCHSNWLLACTHTLLVIIPGN